MGQIHTSSRLKRLCKGHLCHSYRFLGRCLLEWSHKLFQRWFLQGFTSIPIRNRRKEWWSHRVLDLWRRYPLRPDLWDIKHPAMTWWVLADHFGAQSRCLPTRNGVSNRKFGLCQPMITMSFVHRCAYCNYIYIYIYIHTQMCVHMYLITRSILDEYFNPLVIWYQWDYLCSPAQNLHFLWSL